MSAALGKAEASYIVETVERYLEVALPTSYRNFLINDRNELVDGFNMVNLESDGQRMDATDATTLVRISRPTLPRCYVPVTLVKSSAVCLDLSRADEHDAPLVEIALTNQTSPQDIDETFSSWLQRHQQAERRLREALHRIEYRQMEAGDRKGIREWSAPIFRVKDYIIGIAAYRYSYHDACLEVDAFLPIDQPHVVAGAPVKILYNEAMIRARDFCGALTIQFTRDLSDDGSEDEIRLMIKEVGRDADGKAILRKDPGRRVPTAVPRALVDLARSHRIDLPHPERGRIEHQVALDLWFATLELPETVVERVRALEAAGYLQCQILAEVVAMGFWTRQEVIWLFENAPRPEALLMGSDPPEIRSSYAESLNYGRAALVATRFMYAIIAEMNGGFTLEDSEEAKVGCAVEANGAFWTLACTDRFYLPDMWLSDPPSNAEDRRWFDAADRLLLLCRPHMPLAEDRELERLNGYLQILLDAEPGAAGASQARCLVLSNEYISPYYCSYVDAVRDFVRLAETEGVFVVFAPTRTDLYLDQDIQTKMHQVRSMTQLPFRLEPKALQVYAIPTDLWKVPDESTASRAIQNASESAEIFGEQLVKKRELRRHEMEFSLMCEVIEREASQHHDLVVEVNGDDSLDLMQALKLKRPALKGVSFSFVTPEDMPRFLEQLQQPHLREALEHIQGGVVVLPQIWRERFRTPTTVYSDSAKAYTIPEAVLLDVDLRKQRRLEERSYASDRNEIERAHAILRDAVAKGQPFSMASIRGRVRSHVFAETIIDYCREDKTHGTSPYKLPIAYADGTRGGPFVLFSLPAVPPPDSSSFFEYNVGLISLRHSESDSCVDRFLVRNRDVQRRATSLQQEELTHTKAYECLDELMRYIRGELPVDLVSASLQILLGSRPDLVARSWSGLKLNLFHSSGFESGGIGAYRAVLDLISKYQGALVVIPHIVSFGGKYKPCQPWF